MDETINTLKKELDAKRKEDQLQVLEIEKEDLLNKEMKSYENNIKVLGLKFLTKDAAKRDDAGRTAWRKMVLQKCLVDTKLVHASKVFHQAGPNKGKEIRGILRDAHPLSQKNGSPVVVAFTESWFANQIKDKLRDTKTLVLGDLKIYPHYPVIIDCLKNEALRERRKMLSAQLPGGARKIVCHTSMTKPWVRLMDIQDDENKTRTPVSFRLDDGRLANPARTFAVIALEGRPKFSALKHLSEEQRNAVPKDVMTSATSNMDTD
jgi:hypothetical protein